MPAPANDDAEVLFADWLDAHPDATADDLAALVEAHPAHAAELGRMFADWRAFAPVLRELVPGSISVSMGATRSGVGDAGREESHGHLEDQLGLDLPDAQRYAFRRVIGQGGGGVVLKVWDGKLHRFLAMKLVLEQKLSPTPVEGARRAASLSRFIDEARIASQLDHPSIVPVHEIGADANGRVFFTMRLVEGDDLARVYARLRAGDDGVTQLGVLQALSRAAEAVAYAHARGVVHRDLKPANIMIGRHGEVHVMDWGLARILTREAREDAGRAGQRPLDTLRANEREQQPDSPLLTGDGAILGTPAYMSPEQAQGDLGRVGLRSDVYAFGAMIYELVTGTPPFVAPGEAVSGREILERVRRGPPRRLAALAPAVPPELAAICERAMAREPNDRYVDVRALDEDLRAYLEGRVVRAYETGTWAETRKWVARNRALAAALATVVIVATLGSVGFAIKAGEAERNAASSEREARRADLAAAAAREEAYIAALVGAQQALVNRDLKTARGLLNGTPPEARGWEWRQLVTETELDSQPLIGEGGPVLTLASGPRGRRLVMGRVGLMEDYEGGSRMSDTPIATLWDLESRTKVADLGGKGSWITSAEFTPEGDRLIVAGAGYGAAIHDAETGELLHELHRSGVGNGYARLSHDGATALTCDSKTVYLWNTLTGELLRQFSEPRFVQNIALSDDTSCAAVGTQTGAVRVIDLASGDDIAELVGHTDSLRSIAFEPGGTRLLTASWDGTARLWETAGGLELFRWEDAQASGRFSRDGSKILVEGHVTHLWDVVSERQIAEWRGATSNGGSVRFSPDDRWALTGTVKGVVEVRDAMSGSLLHSLEGPGAGVSAVAMTPDGGRLVAGFSDRSVHLWEMSSTLPSVSLRPAAPHFSYASESSWSSDGELIVLSREGVLEVWDTQLGSLLACIPMGHVAELVLNDAADRLITVDQPDEESVVVVDLVTGLVEARIPTPKLPRYTRELSLSPDGRHLLGGGYRHAWVMDLEAGEPLLELPFERNVTECIWAPDGQSFAVGGDDGLVVLGNLSALEAVRLSAGGGSGVTALAFSEQADRLLVATDDGSTVLWDVLQLTEIVNLESQGDTVRVAGFAPGLERIVTAGGANYIDPETRRPTSGGFVQISDAHSGRALLRRQVNRELGGVLNFAWLDGGATLGTLSQDNHIEIYSTEIAQARSARRAGHDEWAESGAAIIEPLLRSEGDLLSVVEAVRSDDSLDDSSRRSALRACTVLAESARDLVRAASRECALPAHVVAAVEYSAEVDPIVRDFALHWFSTQPLRPWKLSEFVETVLAEGDGVDSARLEHAAHCAATAVEAVLRSDDIGAASSAVAITFSKIALRVGRLADALEVMLKIERALHERGEFVEDDLLEALGVASWHLGHAEQAVNYRALLADRAARSPWDDETQACLVRLDTLMGDGG